MADLRHLSHRLAYQLSGRLAVRRMRPQDAVEQAVGRAVARALEGRVERDEAFWQQSIETLRRKMARDDTQLNFADYGAEKSAGSATTRTIAEVQTSSVPPHQGLALHVLVRDLRPETCLELGTCLGVSTAYLASALDLNDHGTLTTIEGGKDLARVASINFSRLGLKNTHFVTGQFERSLPDVLNDIAPVDLAYVDGHHDGEATSRYFTAILQHCSSRAVIVLDDIRWSRGMRDAWRNIRSHPRVTASLDLFSFGICITGPGNESDDRQTPHA